MAPEASHNTHKPKTQSPVQRTQLLPVLRPNFVYSTARASGMFPTTESPRTRTEQEEDRPRFSHEKQIVLNDLKKFAANFKLGPKASPSEMPANDVGPINSVHSSSKNSRAGQRFFATRPVPAFTPLANGKAALSQVFGTNELLENIISSLPFKQLFDVKRVSKQWKSLVDNSPGIQEKLFIRRSNKESEFWVLKEARRLGLQPFGVCRKCENYGVRLRFIRHIDSHPPIRICTVISVTLNPILQESCLAVTPDGTISHKTKLLPGASVNYSAWVNALRYNEACIQNMFVTDPPCDTAYIEYLIIYFGNPKPALPYPDVDHNYRHHPRLDTLRVSVSGITVEARSGLRMRDILRAALRSRGTARCTLSDRTYCERRDATMYEIIDVMMERLGWTSIPESPFMEMRMHLSTLGSKNIWVATEEERETGTANWKCDGYPV